MKGGGYAQEHQADIILIHCIQNVKYVGNRDVLDPKLFDCMQNVEYAKEYGNGPFFDRLRAVCRTCK